MGYIYLSIYLSISDAEFSPTGNWREVPSPNAAQRRVDRFVYPTRPRPENLRAPRKGAAEDPLPGVRRPLKSYFTRQTDRQMLHWPKRACSALSPIYSRSCRSPPYSEYVEGECRGGERLRWNWLSLWEMTRNWKTVILPLITVFGFSNVVFISPTFHCERIQSNGTFGVCLKVEERWPFRKMDNAAIEGDWASHQVDRPSANVPTETWLRCAAIWVHKKMTALKKHLPASSPDVLRYLLLVHSHTDRLKAHLLWVFLLIPLN